MLNIIYFIISLCITGGALSLLENVMRAKDFWTFTGASVIVFVIWLIVILNSIRSIINYQLSDKYDIPKFKALKKSYVDEMEAYKKEMQTELLDKYRQFEETLMESVKDSKLIAAVLEQGSYAKVLNSYNSKIRQFLMDIHSYDRYVEKTITKMRIRQSNFLTGYSFFIPENLFYFDGEIFK